MTDSSGPKSFKRAGVGMTAPVLSDGQAQYSGLGSESRGGVKTYFHSGLKNTDVQTSSAQSVSAEKMYDAFGNVVSSTGSWKSPFSYAGKFGYQEDSDTGLKLLGHRYYDSSTGRFLTRDPIKDGRNWYVYCASNPVDSFDATGLWKAVIIIGKVNWNEHATVWMIVRHLKAWLKSIGATEIVVLSEKNEKEVIEALSDDEVEGFAYIGHGVPDDFTSWQSELADGDVLDVTTANKIARRRKNKMRHAIIYSCNSGASDEIWYDVAELVYTWDHGVWYVTLFKHNYDVSGKFDVPSATIGGSRSLNTSLGAYK